VPATAELVQRLEARRSGDLGRRCRRRSRRCSASPDARLDGAPSVILVVGVNGTGKTTTIGKLARSSAEHGRSVLVARRDTFRAAAEEQLEIWAERAGADFVGSSAGATRRRSPTTRSRRRRRAAATWSSSTPPAGCTRRRT
jgi:fused signal recognition particle receptor